VTAAAKPPFPESLVLQSLSAVEEAPAHQLHLPPSLQHQRLYHQLFLLRKRLQVGAFFEDSVCVSFLFPRGVVDVITLLMCFTHYRWCC
jgi:hypothetical protein